MVGKKFKGKVNGAQYTVARLIEKDGREGYRIEREGTFVCNVSREFFESECVKHLEEVTCDADR